MLFLLVFTCNTVNKLNIIITFLLYFIKTGAQPLVSLRFLGYAHVRRTYTIKELSLFIKQYSLFA